MREHLQSTPKCEVDSDHTTDDWGHANLMGHVKIEPRDESLDGHVPTEPLFDLQNDNNTIIKTEGCQSPSNVVENVARADDSHMANETHLERRRRINRENVARWRARNKARSFISSQSESENSSEDQLESTATRRVTRSCSKRKLLAGLSEEDFLQLDEAVRAPRNIVHKSVVEEPIQIAQEPMRTFNDLQAELITSLLAVPNPGCSTTIAPLGNGPLLVNRPIAPLAPRIAPFPVSLSFVNYSANDMVTVLNYHYLLKPLIVQLVDDVGNPCHKPGIKVQLMYTDGLQFNPPLQTTESDGNGQINYGTPMVYANSRSHFGVCPAKLCIRNCYGIFTITTRTWHMNKEFTGPSIRFHIPSNSDNPLKILVISSNTANYCAGAALEEYKVCVVAENNCILTTIQPNHITMKLRREGCTDLLCTYPASTDVESPVTGIFNFRKLPAPTKAGTYCIQFVYKCNTCIISGNIIVINVFPGKPVKLVTSYSLGTPIVSNCKVHLSRMIVKRLKLEIKDTYDNTVEQSQNESLCIKLMCEDDALEKPTFAGGITALQVPINGEIMLAHIMLEENCPGVDGQEYFLRFEVISDNIDKDIQFDIPFFFYRDAKKQDLLKWLTREKDTLTNSIKAYHELFETSRQLLVALQDNVKQLAEEEKNSIKALRGVCAYDKSLTSLSNVKALLTQRKSERSKHLKTRRRNCIAPMVSNDNQILGKVGHLAAVANEDIARLLSWHLVDKMECTVTHTTKKALEICQFAGGTQQIIALDLLCKKEMMDLWNCPLPHVNITGDFYPSGNPIPARDYLIFSGEFDSCKIVFGALLGETVIIDTFKEAIKYRQEVAKVSNCPTILTRDGKRIESNGAFSGLENLWKNHRDDFIFNSPLADRDQDLVHIIGLLECHLSVVEQLTSAKQELEHYHQQSVSTVNVERLQDCKKMELRLARILPQIANLTMNATTGVTQGSVNSSGVTQNEVSIEDLLQSCLSGVTPQLKS